MSTEQAGIDADLPIRRSAALDEEAKCQAHYVEAGKWSNRYALTRFANTGQQGRMNYG